MDLHAFYIAAGELAGERVAGLVEEDGDELERREQERPPEEEDDDGGDADGGDEDPLVAVAAALQLPVDGHPLVAAADLLFSPPARIRGKRGCAGGGAQHGSSEWKLPGALALARSNWKRAGLRAQEPRERWAGGAGGCGGRVCPRRVKGREILIAPVSPRRPRSHPADARSARADNWTFVVNERTPDYVAVTGGGAPNNGR